jgi:UDP-N-acetylmuramoylalanine--D-glutamate ligase
MTDLADIRSLAVLGLGSSGRAAALLAAHRLVGVAVTALDAKREEELGATLAELRSAGVALDLGPRSHLPERVDLLVKSPGVPNESPVVQAALARGVPIWGEFEFAYRFLDATTIAITGTNGKTTTTELTGAILAGAGLPVVVAGNVGHPTALVPGQAPPGAIVVAEVSSFQMEYVERFRPRVAALLNLTEDHLDRHATYDGYVAAKLRLFENQGEGDLALLNGDDSGVAAELEGRVAGVPAAVGERETEQGAVTPGAATPGRGAIPGRGRLGFFALGAGREPLRAGLAGELLWVAGDDGRRAPLCRRGELALKGEHNLSNSLAAAATAAALGVAPPDIARVLTSFPGVAHRLQVVTTVGGVTYVNDSKATNIDSTLKALTAYSGPVHLILGGYGKGSPFDELAQACVGRIKEAILIGKAAMELEEAFARVASAAEAKRAGATAAGSEKRGGAFAGASAPPPPRVMLPDLPAALEHARRVAEPGDVVLLSPACASYDQYRNFEERGEHFMAMVRELEERS